MVKQVILTQVFPDIDGQTVVARISRVANKHLAKVAVQCSADIFVVN
jgi:hypothetical protein